MESSLAGRRFGAGEKIGTSELGQRGGGACLARRATRIACAGQWRLGRAHSFEPAPVCLAGRLADARGLKWEVYAPALRRAREKRANKSQFKRRCAAELVCLLSAGARAARRAAWRTAERASGPLRARFWEPRGPGRNLNYLHLALANWPEEAEAVAFGAQNKSRALGAGRNFHSRSNLSLTCGRRALFARPQASQRANGRAHSSGARGRQILPGPIYLGAGGSDKCALARSLARPRKRPKVEDANARAARSVT